MDYFKSNKSAWEDGFKNKKPGWGENAHIKLKSGRLAFFNADMQKELEQINFRGKKVAQFCCNDGTELLSLMDLGADSGVGFDIAENIIAQAKNTAAKAGIENCEFVACNILDIPAEYHGRFDIALLTVGAICWFKDLEQLFGKVAECLNNDGLLIMQEMHPVEYMLAVPGEEGFDPDDLNRFAHSYFRKEPWIDTGMGYMSGDYESANTFTSFSHTLSDIINALSANGIKTVKFNEYDYDIAALTDVYDNKGLPLSFILVGEK